MKSPPAFILRSDADGAFRVEGVEPGKHKIQVRASGFALWSSEVVVQAARIMELAVTLSRGGVVFGRVTNAEGEPILGEVGLKDMGKFAHVGMRFGKDGRFKLDSLPLGEIRIRASSYRAGKVETTLVLEEGKPIEWNPVLGAGTPIRGRVVSENGEPMARRWVMISCESETSILTSVTDAAGRFVFNDCNVGFHSLEVRDEFDRPAIAVRHRVRPSGAEIEIRIPDDALPSVHFRGTILGPGGQPTDAMQIMICGGGEWLHSRTDPSGSFKYGPFAPGTYQLRIAYNPDYPQISLGSFQAKKGETVDVGTIRLAPLKDFSLTVINGKGQKVPSGKFWVAGMAGMRVGRSGFTSGLPSPLRLPPGCYILSIEDPPATRSFEIHETGSSDLLVNIGDGIDHTIRCLDTSDKTPFVEVRDGSGELRLRRRASSDGEHIECKFNLPLGNYTAKARARGGKKGEAKILLQHGAPALTQMHLK